MEILVISGIGALLLFIVVLNNSIITNLTTLNNWIGEILESGQVASREATDLETQFIFTRFSNLTLHLNKQDKFRVFRFKEIRVKLRELIMLKKIRNYLILALLVYILTVMTILYSITSH